MTSDNFEFNGDWEYNIELPLLSGFQERNGGYTSKSSDKPNIGLFKIEFEDDLTESPDPYPEQINALTYIFENQDAILLSIIQTTLLELPAILHNYGLENEDEYQDLNPEKIRSLIGISSIYIKIISKDNYSYYDIMGGCNWDEEHGLNILLHKDRVISFGTIDGNSTYEAEKDNGTYDATDNGLLEKKMPKKYLPHTKYNKLKPAQIFANETYEYTLISQGYNEDFIKGIETGDIDINGKWISQDKTYLEAACWFNNNKIVEYLLNKNADIRYALHNCGSNQEAMEMLLNKGADINFKYANGNTVLFELVNSLESFHRAYQYYRTANRLDLITEEGLSQLSHLKNKIKNCINKGADPFIKNAYGYNCFDIMRNADDNSKAEVNTFLRKCVEDKEGQLSFMKRLWNKLK